jgi:hypothetical protein
MTITREHDYDPENGICRHCRDSRAANGDSGRLCIGRELPRSIPGSIFAGDITGIGDRLKAIQDDERAAYEAAVKDRNPEPAAALDLDQLRVVEMTIEEQARHKVP